MKQLFKRQAPEDEGEEGEEQATTPQTHIFGKHLHKVKITTPTTTLETEGNLSHRRKRSFVNRNFYRRGANGGADRINRQKDSGEGDGNGWRDRGYNGHPEMGRRGHLHPHRAHNSRHLRLLHPTVFPQTTLQRRQERHERRWSEIGTVTWICL